MANPSPAAGQKSGTGTPHAKNRGDAAHSRKNQPAAAAGVASSRNGKQQGDDDDEDNDDDDDDDEDDEDGDDALAENGAPPRGDQNAAAAAATTNSAASEPTLQPGGTLTSGSNNKKKKKRAKSKAAAKLKKKATELLGGGAGASSSSSALRPRESAAAASSSSSSPSSSAAVAPPPTLSDDQVAHIQRAVADEHGADAAKRVDRANLAKVMQLLNLERNAMLKSQEARHRTQRAIADHKFWKTQPVARPDDAPASVAEEGPIHANMPPSEVRQEPYPLPKDFEWVTVDIDDQEQLKEVYDLLSANYVEDDDASLRFNYTPEFLHWVLKHPGYRKNWHVGVRVTSSRKLVAFISGIPHELRVRERSYHSTEINFLCVHKKLRSKRLAPVLIKEITRQHHLTGVFQAIYTGGVVIPTPISCARYYHRTLNARKLLDIGFSGVPQGMSLDAYVARYEVGSSTKLRGLREMRPSDVPAVGRLMRRYMSRFDMAPRFRDDEVEHVLLSGRGVEGSAPREGAPRQRQVTWTYVVEGDTPGHITDFISFYSLPSSVLENEKHATLNAAYLFYYATDVVFQDANGAATASASSSAQPSEPQSAPSNGTATGDLDALPSWQRSDRTALSEAERRDELGVTKWDQETPTTKARLKARLNELVSDLLVLAKKSDFDVVNCLTVMDNALFLADQKFGPGDGFLRFYLFNWRVRPVAGGMGSRAGEAELDPVVQLLRREAAAEHEEQARRGGGAKKKLSEQELLEIVWQRRPRPEMGSGNGVVMV